MELQEETTAKKFDTWLDSKTTLSKSEGGVAVVDDTELQSLFKKFVDMGFKSDTDELDKAIAERDMLMKSSDMVLKKVETLIEKVTHQDMMIKRLSETAVPPPVLRSVSKSVDSEINPQSDATVQKFVELTPQEQALAVIKATQILQRS